MQVVNLEEDIATQLKCFIFASLISANNDKLDEETKQEIIRRYDDHKKTGDQYDNWEFILEPIEDIEMRNKYINLLD